MTTAKIKKVILLSSTSPHSQYADKLPLTYLKMGIKYLNLSSFGQFWQYTTKSLL